MTLIKSISGMRGTIGGAPRENLTPVDIVNMVAAFGEARRHTELKRIVVGRDGRLTGQPILEIVKQTLVLQGFEVIDLDYSTTPTVAVMVEHLQANGGIMVSASHNPENWNALKFFNQKGEIIGDQEGKDLLHLSDHQTFQFAPVLELGKIEVFRDAFQIHIDKICSLPLVDVASIRKRQFKVAVDCINSSGALAIIPLLEQLGCTVFPINDDLTETFAHNPEPKYEHLDQIRSFIQGHQIDVGIVVDPDVDRLCFVDERGNLFGEEYTIVSIADYILSTSKGPLVSNLSSTQALNDIAKKHDVVYHASAVGEVNVVNKMKEVNAIFGGEGNGGVIYPALHYGRDGLVGVALFLSQISTQNLRVSELRKLYPDYVITKLKADLPQGYNPDQVIDDMSAEYTHFDIDTTDGLKIYFDHEWVHLRKSNTEPIIRIYAESNNHESAEHLAAEWRKRILARF